MYRWEAQIIRIWILIYVQQIIIIISAKFKAINSRREHYTITSMQGRSLQRWDSNVQFAIENCCSSNMCSGILWIHTTSATIQMPQNIQIGAVGAPNTDYNHPRIAYTQSGCPSFNSSTIVLFCDPRKLLQSHIKLKITETRCHWAGRALLYWRSHTSALIGVNKNTNMYVYCKACVRAAKPFHEQLLFEKKIRYMTIWFVCLALRASTDVLLPWMCQSDLA